MGLIFFLYFHNIVYISFRYRGFPSSEHYSLPLWHVTLHNYYELNFINYLINMYYTIYCNTLDLLTFITQKIITLIQYQDHSQYYR